MVTPEYGIPAPINYYRQQQNTSNQYRKNDIDRHIYSYVDHFLFIIIITVGSSWNDTNVVDLIVDS